MALNCKLNRNILRTTSCGYSLLEINDIYIANYDDISTTITADSANCESVNSISATSDNHFYHIVPAKNSVTFTDELVVEDSGAKYRTHTLTFNISNRYDACLHTDFDNLSLGRFIGVVKTADGSYLMLGRVFEQIAISGSIEPWIGVWLPNIIFAIIAIIVYRKAPK